LFFVRFICVLMSLQTASAPSLGLMGMKSGRPHAQVSSRTVALQCLRSLGFCPRLPGWAH
jgi:hypothetical protein